MNIVITGCAGFIGFHVAYELLSTKDCNILGLDNLNAYYDPLLKKARLKVLNHQRFSFKEVDISKFDDLVHLVKPFKPNLIIHLAAQAGVRYSVIKPQAYVESNLIGHSNILELTRVTNNPQLIYASSSSVYGNSKNLPYKESDLHLSPQSFYAATKLSCEVLTESYKNLYKINATGLRFFTVYGPWGRPDMAYYIFTKKILDNEPIDIFGRGNAARDMTYISDVVSGITELIETRKDSDGTHEIFNIGNSHPITLTSMLTIIEESLKKKAIINYQDSQIGDVENTFADTTKIANFTSFQSKISPQEGLNLFVEWYKKEFEK